MTAAVSAVAVASNVFLMSETLPRIVEARRAKQAAEAGDAAAHLLADEGPPALDSSAPVPDIEGVAR